MALFSSCEGALYKWHGGSGSETEVEVPICDQAACLSKGATDYRNRSQEQLQQMASATSTVCAQLYATVVVMS